MIRKAKIKDLKIIYSLLQEGVSSGKVLKRSSEELKKALKSFFVYEENGKIVGCCSLEIYSQKLAEIRSLVVTSGYRNRGIGSALVQRCLDEAKGKGIYQVLSVTDKNDKEITLFDSVGIALEDYSVLRLTYELAQKYNIGEERSLVPILEDPKDLICQIRFR